MAMCLPFWSREIVYFLCLILHCIAVAVGAVIAAAFWNIPSLLEKVLSLLLLLRLCENKRTVQTVKDMELTFLGNYIKTRTNSAWIKTPRILFIRRNTICKIYRENSNNNSIKKCNYGGSSISSSFRLIKICDCLLLKEQKDAPPIFTSMVFSLREGLGYDNIIISDITSSSDGRHSSKKDGHPPIKPRG